MRQSCHWRWNTGRRVKILLYNPDNGVTQNFMPHLWMFLLQSLTPPGHKVILIDGNTQPMTDPELVKFALDQEVGLVGIGAMTRMIAKAYRVADALRAAGIRVVMGGPHVTEEADDRCVASDCSLVLHHVCGALCDGIAQFPTPIMTVNLYAQSIAGIDVLCRCGPNDAAVNSNSKCIPLHACKMFAHIVAKLGI